MGRRMTATKQFRQLLDEHGVEYRTYDNNKYDFVTWYDSPDGKECSFDEYGGGTTMMKMWHVTPAQAIEATLGRETCKLERHGSLADWPSMVCWSCSECGFGWHHSIYDKQFSFCPNCGRKIVKSEKKIFCITFDELLEENNKLRKLVKDIYEMYDKVIDWKDIERRMKELEIE